MSFPVRMSFWTLKKLKEQHNHLSMPLSSDLIRKYGNEILDSLQFKSCNDTIKGIITIVVDYMQESHN